MLVVVWIWVVACGTFPSAAVAIVFTRACWSIDSAVAYNWGLLGLTWFYLTATPIHKKRNFSRILLNQLTSLKPIRLLQNHIIWLIYLFFNLFLILSFCALFLGQDNVALWLERIVLNHVSATWELEL